MIGGSREGQLWRANVDADELNGYVEYRQPPARGRPAVCPAGAPDDRARRPPTRSRRCSSEQPDTLPALDIVVDDFELRGKKLGRLEIDAVNRGAGTVAREGGVREWRLNKLNLSMPEATFSATGNWAAVGAQAAAPGGPRPGPRPAGERRRTAMNFRLDIADSGQLLDALRHEGRGAPRQGPHGRPGGLAAARRCRSTTPAGRRLLRERRVGPVPQGRPGHGQAAGRAEPAGAAAAADAGLPRRVQRGLRLRLRARRRHHRSRAWPPPTTCR